MTMCAFLEPADAGYSVTGPHEAGLSRCQSAPLRIGLKFARHLKIAHFPDALI